jgi:hypothetical protein
MNSDATSETVTEISTRYGDAPNIRNSRLEEAAHKLVLRLRAEIESGDLVRTGSNSADLDDLLELSVEVDEAIQMAHSAVLPVPQLLEATGNVEERELAARLMEQKQKASLNYASRIPSRREMFEHTAEAFRAAASDLRAGLHLPETMIEGRVIPYNDTNDTGIRHESPLRVFFTDIHERNVKAGWWTDLATGEPKKRSVGEMLILFVTEMAEAYEGWLLNMPDDKLPNHPALGVEMADLGIRWADFCGALQAGSILQPDPANNPGDMMFKRICTIAWEYEAIRKTPAAIGDPETADFLPPMDVAAMIDDKLAFNANRPDHKIENRLKEDGKRT